MTEYIELPLLPLRDIVVFPNMVIPLFIGREKSIKSLDAAMQNDRKIMLVAQKSAELENPKLKDLFEIGCIANILQMLKLPDGTVKILVEGSARARVTKLITKDGAPFASVLPVALDTVEQSKIEDIAPEIEALRRAVMQQFDQYVKHNKKIPSEIVTSISNIQHPSRLADTLIAHLPFPLELKQVMLDLNSVQERLEYLLLQLEREVDILNVDQKIRSRVKRQMEKNQREFYLNEQVKAIQKELDNGEDSAETDELENKIKNAKMPKEARNKADSELKKLRMMSPMSAEATVVRTYLETLVALPWSKKSKVKKNLNQAQHILDQDHYGLEKVKERIVEYLAVQQRVEKLKSPILCLVGPPGVGKTSLGQSIAKATGRKYVRMALGGVKDEAEIRGHRKTYIGAMPGRVLQSMSKVGVKNPLFLLDEIDKLGSDFRGDPASALLEVLDPEQNHTFVDHYAEVDFDLSQVMFVATSNSFNIPEALLDRMEVINLSGYTEEEKMNIATRYLIPKQIKANGLTEKEINIDLNCIRDIVRYYTRESGVRSLEREISKICRKVVKAILTAEKKKLKLPVKITSKNLVDYLGVKKYLFGQKQDKNQIGQVVGLAWTRVGGDLLTIEAAIMPGKGKIVRTGSLGDVMKESIEAARTVVRTRAAFYGIDDADFDKKDIHLHVPDGATPKDGPSAGAAMATALVSVYTGIPIKNDVAMTGEITLRGEVTEIGGLKEKLLAALRGGITKVLIPQDNVKDLQEIPANVKQGLEIVPVRWFEQVLEHVLEYQPSPVSVVAAPVVEQDLPKVEEAASIKPAVRRKASRKTSAKH